VVAKRAKDKRREEDKGGKADYGLFFILGMIK